MTRIPARAPRRPTARNTPGQHLRQRPAERPPKALARPPEPCRWPMCAGSSTRWRAPIRTPRSELDYVDPYTLLVSVVLSAQATDVSVNRATQTLFAEANARRRWLRLGVEGVGRHIRSIGLWQGKARNVVALSRLLLERHGGEVPQDRDGAGGAARRRTQDRQRGAERRLRRADDGGGYPHLPSGQPHRDRARARRRARWRTRWCGACRQEMLRDAHHWLILHGRYVCKARRPECWRCVAASWCRYPDKAGAPA